MNCVVTASTPERERERARERETKKEEEERLEEIVEKRNEGA